MTKYKWVRSTFCINLLHRKTFATHEIYIRIYAYMYQIYWIMLSRIALGTAVNVTSMLK